MTFFGELGVVERRLRGLKIGAAVLLVGIQKERVQPSVEIVVTSDGIFRAAARIELADMPDEISKPPLHLGPARQYLRLIHQDRQRVRNRAILDYEGAFLIDFA